MCAPHTHTHTLAEQKKAWGGRGTAPGCGAPPAVSLTRALVVSGCEGAERAAVGPGPPAAGPEAAPREPGRDPARRGPGARRRRGRGIPGGALSRSCFGAMN